jgi:predicted dehydrogenase
VRERLAAMFQPVRTTDALDDLLSDPALDAVVLATPDPSHAELSLRVLEAGERCFVE